MNARLAPEKLRGLVVVDEVQRRPDLFPLLRVLADREGTLRAVPDPRQCLARPHPPELRVAGGPHPLHRRHALQPRGSRGRERRCALDTRLDSALVPGRERPGSAGTGARTTSDVPGTGRARAWHPQAR
ncbi:MAG: hypothetical protein M0C28_23060 [Candidatus Moduliflexus flocculans]|nr:hypothetical protein [Candidatus Moduliflexus flocculans]